MSRNRIIGDKFEEIGTKFLISKDYEILERNFNAPPFGEIDIIAKKENIVIFVEVKGRLSDKYGDGTESITSNKKKRIINSCYIWLEKNNIESEWQIDVINIYKVTVLQKKVLKLKHYKNCITQDDYSYDYK